MPGLSAADVPRVFVNCPFDDEYEPLRDALILSCVACGFLPTSANLKGGGGRLRIDRIIEQLKSAHYSIHDLSRSKGEGEYNHARFNMPLELGMAIYRSRLDEPEHDWLALVPDGPTHLLYVSDLGGFDPERYDGSIEQLVLKVVQFLAVQDDAAPGVGPRLVWDALPMFTGEKKRAMEAWGGNSPPWVRVVDVAQRVLLAGEPDSPT